MQPVNNNTPLTLLFSSMNHRVEDHPLYKISTYLDLTSCLNLMETSKSMRDVMVSPVFQNSMPHAKAYSAAAKTIYPNAAVISSSPFQQLRSAIEACEFDAPAKMLRAAHRRATTNQDLVAFMRHGTALPAVSHLQSHPTNQLLANTPQPITREIGELIKSIYAAERTNQHTLSTTLACELSMLVADLLQPNHENNAGENQAEHDVQDGLEDEIRGLLFGYGETQRWLREESGELQEEELPRGHPWDAMEAMKQSQLRTYFSPNKIDSADIKSLIAVVKAFMSHPDQALQRFALIGLSLFFETLHADLETDEDEEFGEDWIEDNRKFNQLRAGLLEDPFFVDQLVRAIDGPESRLAIEALDGFYYPIPEVRVIKDPLLLQHSATFNEKILPALQRNPTHLLNHTLSNIFAWIKLESLSTDLIHLILATNQSYTDGFEAIIRSFANAPGEAVADNKNLFISKLAEGDDFANLHLKVLNSRFNPLVYTPAFFLSNHPNSRLRGWYHDFVVESIKLLIQALVVNAQNEMAPMETPSTLPQLISQYPTIKAAVIAAIDLGWINQLLEDSNQAQTILIQLDLVSLDRDEQYHTEMIRTKRPRLSSAIDLSQAGR